MTLMTNNHKPIHGQSIKYSTVNTIKLAVKGKTKLYQFPFKYWEWSIECNYCGICWSESSIAEISYIDSFFLACWKQLDKKTLQTLTKSFDFILNMKSPVKILY